MEIWTLRIGVGITMVAFGLHQLVKPQEWVGYIPRWLDSILPSDSKTSIRIHSFGNSILGILLLVGLWHVVIAWATFVWWVSILPFAFMYKWSIGLRDLTIIFSILVLIMLTGATP